MATTSLSWQAAASQRDSVHAWLKGNLGEDAGAVLGALINAFMPTTPHQAQQLRASLMIPSPMALSAPEGAVVTDAVTGGTLLGWNKFQQLYRWHGLGSKVLRMRYRVHKALGERALAPGEATAAAQVAQVGETELALIQQQQLELQQAAATADTRSAAIEFLVKLWKWVKRPT